MILLGTTLFHLTMEKEEDPQNEGKLLSKATHTKLSSISEYYLVSLGDWDTSDYGWFEWSFFVIASLILQIIMLNLLVAFLSDTYARVVDENEETDFKALNDLILDVENMKTDSVESGGG